VSLVLFAAPLWCGAEDGPVCAVPKPALPDPTVEGWGSEAFSDLAQRELKKLLKPLEDGEGDVASIKGAFALRPQVKQVAKTSTATVWRGGETKSGGTVPLKSAIAPLRALFKPGAALHVKVKTVGVSLPEKKGKADAKTMHLVHLDGPSTSGRREINATWEAQWRVDKDGHPDQLRALNCQSWEEVESPMTAPWFSDQTATVLAHAPDAARQFSGGNSFYRLRLQSTLPFFKFGHHGVSVADVNGDGLDDVYVCQPGGLPNRLLLHQPDGTVTEAAASWGVDLLDSCQCSLFADLDNDGDPDLIIATVGALAIFENTGNSFAARVRLPAVVNVYGLAAADFDLDGDLDIYAARYYPGAGEGGELAIPMPQFDANNGGRNFLIRNDGPAAGNGWRRFSDATAETGLDENNRRYSYAAVWDDFNNDGLPDLYVANDYGRNNLYLQTRGPDKKPHFHDVTDAAGLSAGAFGMSASSGDFNRDGWQDIHLGAMFSSAGSRITTQDRFRPDLPQDVRARFRRLARGNTLFANKASPEARFSDISETAGITVGRWSWASLFADIDNDGWQDLMVANGFVTGEIPDDL
jgi:hypothetical protein